MRFATIIIYGVLILSGYVPPKPKVSIVQVCPTPITCYDVKVYTAE